MLFRPAPKCRAWLETDLCQSWEIKGKAKLLLGRHMFAGPAPTMPANDRDHCRW